MKKKLLVTASTFPRWIDDTEPRFVLDLCKHMVEKYDVTVLVPASPGAKNEEYMEGVHILRYHYFPIHKFETLCYPGAIVPRIKQKKVRIFLVPFLFIGLWVKLIQIIKEYDIVHAHWLIPQGIVQSFFRKKYIVTGHGGDVAAFNKGIIRTLKSRCLNRASAVTGVSNHVCTIEKGLAPNVEPYVIPMGVDTAKFCEKNREEDYFGQGENKVVLFVGRIVEIKGLRYLIDAMQRIDNSILYVAGDGPLKNEMEDYAKTSGVQIIFGGSKTHYELQKIYASADVFVMPSITTEKGEKEGFGLVAIEAMASGIPVVASKSGGIVNLIDHGVNGLLCEEKNSMAIADAINRLFKEDVLRKKIISGGKSTAKEYDYSRQAEKYMKIMDAIMN